MCNCMNRGCNCNGALSQCGTQCFSLGPFRATNTVCPPRNTGSIIPFSSGIVPAILTTVAGGLVGTVSAVGFGTSVPGVTIVGNTINLPVVATGFTEAFSVPRAGNITAISAAFTATLALAAFTGTATIRAQVYRAPAGSTTFTATNAFVNLTPAITGPLAVGATFQATADVSNVPVAAGDKLVMVFSVSGGTTVIAALTGAASAGITIS